MFLDGDIDKDESRPEGIPSWAWTITAGVCMLPIYLVFSAFGLVGKGTAASVAALTLIIVVKLHSQYVRQFWFWGIIAAATVVNGLLIAYIPFPNKNYTFPIVAPFGYADYLLISACIRFAQKKGKVVDGSSD